MNIAQSKTMTNKPMTSREAFEQFFYDKEFSKTITKPSKDSVFYKLSNGFYWYNQVQQAWEIWQASQAQQAQTIAELVEALEDADEMIGIEPFEHVAQEAADAHRNIRELIAKVKGKL